MSHSQKALTTSTSSLRPRSISTNSTASSHSSNNQPPLKPSDRDPVPTTADVPAENAKADPKSPTANPTKTSSSAPSESVYLHDIQDSDIAAFRLKLLLGELPELNQRSQPQENDAESDSEPESAVAQPPAVNQPNWGAPQQPEENQSAVSDSTANTSIIQYYADGGSQSTLHREDSHASTQSSEKVSNSQPGSGRMSIPSRKNLGPLPSLPGNAASGSKRRSLLANASEPVTESPLGSQPADDDQKPTITVDTVPDIQISNDSNALAPITPSPSEKPSKLDVFNTPSNISMETIQSATSEKTGKVVRSNSDPDYDRHVSAVESLLQDPEVSLRFRKFCATTFMEENVLFLLELKKYNDAPNQDQAKEIVSTFLRQGAPKELNIGWHTRDITISVVDSKEYTPEVFVRVKREICLLLIQDGVRRFKIHESKVKTSTDSLYSYSSKPRDKNRPTVIVVGLGFGGVGAIKALEKHLDKINLIAIDSKPYFEYTPSWTRAVFNPKIMEESILPHARYLDPRTDLIVGRVNQISEYHVYVNGRSLRFDFLIMAMGPAYGQSQTHTPLPVFAPSIVDPARFYVDLGVLESNETKSVAVIGGGPLGVEMAISIRTKYPEKKVILLHAHSALMNSSPQSAAKKALETLKNAGVEVHLGRRVMRFLGGFNRGVIETDQGEQFIADRVFIAMGVEANTRAARKEFKKSMNIEGKIIVDKYYSVAGYDHIFAVGDCAVMPAEERGAAAALRQGATAAYNILRLMEGKFPKSAGKGKMPPLLKRGPSIVTLGDTKAMYIQGNSITVSSKWEDVKQYLPKLFFAELLSQSNKPFIDLLPTPMTQSLVPAMLTPVVEKDVERKLSAHESSSSIGSAPSPTASQEGLASAFRRIRSKSISAGSTPKPTAEAAPALPSYIITATPPAVPTPTAIPIPGKPMPISWGEPTMPPQPPAPVGAPGNRLSIMTSGLASSGPPPLASSGSKKGIGSLFGSWLNSPTLKEIPTTPTSVSGTPPLASGSPVSRTSLK